MDAPHELLRFVFTTLDRLHLEYLVGGSFASSIFGNRRSTNDLDLVVEISEFDVEPFVAAFSKEFMVSQASIEQAIAANELYSSFQITHEEELFRVDFFMRSYDDFSQAEFERARRVEIVPGLPSPVSGPECIVLRKLQWYVLGGRVSDRQWNDIVGVLEIQKGHLDESFMDTWSARLGLRELLDDARSQVVV